MLGLNVLLAGITAVCCADPGRAVAVSLTGASYGPVFEAQAAESPFKAFESIENALASVIPHCTLRPAIPAPDNATERSSTDGFCIQTVVTTNRPIRLEPMIPLHAESGDEDPEILTLGVTDVPMEPIEPSDDADESAEMVDVTDPDHTETISPPEPEAPTNSETPPDEAPTPKGNEPVRQLPPLHAAQFGAQGGRGITDFGSALLAGGEPIKMQPVTTAESDSPPDDATKEMEEVTEDPADNFLELTAQPPSKLLRLQVDESMVVTSRIKLDRVEVPDPNIVDVSVTSPHEVTIVGKTVGTTKFVITGEGQIQSCLVMVGPNFKPLQNLIRAVSPQSSVRVDALNGTIVLTGRAPDVESARRIEEMAKVFQNGEVLNHITVSGVQQTMLRVTVAEVNKEALRALGINWAIGGSNLSRDFFMANNIGQLNPTNFGSNGLPDLGTGQLTYSVAPVGTSPLTNITFGFPRAELQFFMNALRENSLARTLAEPTLVAISGQTATFLAGGEVPIPVTQGGAVAGAITLEYKEFGVRLAFTPTVLGNQMMRLHVMSEVSDAVESSRVVGTLPLFTFATRRVETTIECGNGQSFAIAGLLSDNVRAISSKIPGIGDIPVIGALFTSVEYRNDKTELVVLVTPELVEAMDPQQVVAPPGADMKKPTDFELYGMGLLEGISTPEDVSASGDEPPVAVDPAATSRQHSLAELPLHGPWGAEEFAQD